MGRSITWICVCLLLLIGCSGQDDPVLVEQDNSAELPISTPTLPLPALSYSTATPITIDQPIAESTTERAISETVSQPTPEPTPLIKDVLLATSPNGTAIHAKRVGTGEIKVVLVGDRQPFIKRLYNYFLADPTLIPEPFSLWFVEDINPDGNHDVIRDADTAFDGCSLNDRVGRAWISAEARALRNFVGDAFLVTFFENAPANVIHNDSCQRSAQASTLLAGSGDNPDARALFSTSPLANTQGHFVDYLASRGIPAVTMGVSETDRDAATTRIADLIRGYLVSESFAWQGWLTDGNVGTFRFSADTLIHPLAIKQLNGTTYILDSGRILSIGDNGVQRVLGGGDFVEEVRVLELLDLATDHTSLLALDRAGDVYRLTDGVWTVERYDRPIRDRSAHYYVAIGADSGTRRNLIETSAPLLLRYDGEDEKRSNLPDDHYPLDVAVGWIGDAKWSYVLLQEKMAPNGRIVAFENGVEQATIEVDLFQPRQLAVSGTFLAVSDLNGRRVRVLSRADFRTVATHQFVDNRPISSIAFASDSLLLAGRDAVYQVGGSGEIFVDSAEHRITTKPHDPAVLSQLTTFNIPIGIPQFIQRDYQLAGAPRHYRLGVHEGFDFYWQRGSQIKAAGSGTVIRADWDYQEPYAELFDVWRGESRQLGYTSEEANDFFRGRQVWIDHGNNVVTRYVHLSSIDPVVQVGAWVEAEQIIARVGNSGSPASLEGEDEDAHLHFEMWLGGNYVGQWIRPIEARMWLREILR